ncbi:MAG: hypothetical protein ACO1OG_11810 [Devosia sp.]
MTKFALSAGTALAMLMASSALALECPIAAAIDDAAVAGSIAEYLPADTDLEAPDALQSAVFELKQAGVPDDTILDNLLSVYCAAVNATDLSDADKTQKVEAFSETADTAVFGGAQ